MHIWFAKKIVNRGSEGKNEYKFTPNLITFNIFLIWMGETPKMPFGVIIDKFMPKA